MKKLTAIGLLTLLLYNMFGLTMAVLFFEDDYQTASASEENDRWQTVKMHLPTLPYNTPWEDTEGQAGLIREGNSFYNVTEKRHENDTLFVTLKANQNARDRFFELVSMIQEITDQNTDTAQNPLGKALQSLNNLVKVYLSPTSIDWTSVCVAILDNALCYATPNQMLLFGDSLLHSPPPEWI